MPNPLVQDRAVAVMGHGPFSAALFAARYLRMVFDEARTVPGARRVECGSSGPGTVSLEALILTAKTHVSVRQLAMSQTTPRPMGAAADQQNSWVIRILSSGVSAIPMPDLSWPRFKIFVR